MNFFQVVENESVEKSSTTVGWVGAFLPRWECPDDDEDEVEQDDVGWTFSVMGRPVDDEEGMSRTMVDGF